MGNGWLDNHRSAVYNKTQKGTAGKRFSLVYVSTLLTIETVTVQGGGFCVFMITATRPTLFIQDIHGYTRVFSPAAPGVDGLEFTDMSISFPAS
jgi:hypothetical protein